MIRRTVLVLGIVATASIFGSRAEAACHFFTVGASSTVTEGNKVSVIVERDASVADSSVRVRTVNKTAKAPADFVAYDERVSFTGSQTQKTITIQTNEDVINEPDEAFQIAVSDAQGCAPNQNYGYGEPATVTIKDDDADPVTPSPPRPTTTTTIIPARTRTPTPTDSPTPSPTPSESPSPTPSPSETPAFTPTTVEEDSGFPWLPVLGVVGLLAAGAGALILTRMRGGGV